MDVDALDALLPQMQCRQCGFAGCRPYAEALVLGQAPFDRCVPGGVSLITQLKHTAETHSPSRPSTSFPIVFQERPLPQVAWIDESQCIGCTLCIAVCPVDAIVGAQQLMHTVIEHDCTGCGLCVKPCPVECIHIREHPSPDVRSGYSVAPEKSKEAYERQQKRRTPEYHQKAERLLALYYPVQSIAVAAAPEVPKAERTSLIEQMRARAKARREGGG